MGGASTGYVRFEGVVICVGCGLVELRNESLYLSLFFEKFVEKNQVSLQSDKNNRYFTCRPIYICDNISLVSS